MKSYVLDEAKNANALFVFAHGAGADMNAEFMSTVTNLLLVKGISVVRFNFPYMALRELEGKKRPPDRMPTLVEDYAVLLQELSSSLPIFIGGKSMGSRVAATLLSEQLNINEQLREKVKGLIALGYPFHPINKPDNLRLLPLQKNTLPTLIVQGERDKLGNQDEVTGYRLPHNCQVEFLPDGDHDLKPRVKSGFTHAEHIQATVCHVEQFIKRYRHA